MNELQMAALTFLAFGIAIPIYLLFKLNKINKFKKEGIKSVANVVHAERKIGYKGAILFILSIVYRDQNGTPYAGTITGPRKNVIGDTIPIIFSPQNPAIFKTDFGERLKVELIISMIFLLITAGFCFWVFVL